jgi:hypothetical protein
VNCDREAWVKARLRTDIRMASAVHYAKRTGADTDLLESAWDGIVNGAAVEIIHTLDLEPAYVNLRRCAWCEDEDPRSPPSGFDIPQKTTPNKSPITSTANAPAPLPVRGQIDLDNLPKFEVEWKNMLTMCQYIQKTPEWKKYWLEHQRAKRAEQRKIRANLKEQKTKRTRTVKLENTSLAVRLVQEASQQSHLMPPPEPLNAKTLSALLKPASKTKQALLKVLKAETKNLKQPGHPLATMPPGGWPEPENAIAKYLEIKLASRAN